MNERSNDYDQSNQILLGDVKLLNALRDAKGSSFCDIAKINLLTNPKIRCTISTNA